MLFTSVSNVADAYTNGGYGSMTIIIRQKCEGRKKATNEATGGLFLFSSSYTGVLASLLAYWSMVSMGAVLASRELNSNLSSSGNRDIGRTF